MATTPQPAGTAPRLLAQVREQARYLHYSLRTEKAYVYWVRFFVRWSGLRHPRDMGAAEVQAFLAMLATQRRVSASTQSQALSALLFLYRVVLSIDLPWLQDLQRPSYKRRIPAVLTSQQVTALLATMPAGTIRLVAHLLYGTGMRLMEALRLRVKDIDFDRAVIVIREAKGAKDRVVMLPQVLADSLRLQVAAARAQWEHDRATSRGGVQVPHGLERKYPRVGLSWNWFWVFPAPSITPDPDSGVLRRHHLHEDRFPARHPACRHAPPA